MASPGRLITDVRRRWGCDSVSREWTTATPITTARSRPKEGRRLATGLSLPPSHPYLSEGAVEIYDALLLVLGLFVIRLLIRLVLSRLVGAEANAPTTDPLFSEFAAIKDPDVRTVMIRAKLLEMPAEELIPLHPATRKWILPYLHPDDPRAAAVRASLKKQ